MKIGIDLSILQGYHRFRGIGSVVINFINHLTDDAKNKNSFVFFVEKNNESMAFELLNLKGIKYEIRYLHMRHYHMLPGEFSIISKVLYKILAYIEYHIGDPRISRKNLADIDRYIHFDQCKKLPVNSKRNTILVMYDLIPFVLESDYLWSYSTAKQNGLGLFKSVKCAFLRYQYKLRIKINLSRAKSIISISEHTKDDCIKYFGVNKNKVDVVLLGADYNDKKASPKSQKLYAAYKRKTVWGPIKHQIDLTKKPFILFVGGVDKRRQITELLAAFNNLKARGVDISLVLSGESFEYMENIPDKNIKNYIHKNPSYRKDIYYMGFTTNSELNWLYKNALAFVFPSIYEGFGLPVLEAMRYGCPTITYNNSSLVEVGGKDVIYVDDFLGITNAVQELINNPTKAKTLSKNGIIRSSKFTWDKTVNSIFSVLNS